MSTSSQLFANTVQLAAGQHILFLNSAAEPFLSAVASRCPDCAVTLAEDNVALLQNALDEMCQAFVHPLYHIAFHEYAAHGRSATMDAAIMNLLYQPNNAWIHYGLQLARYALKPGGRLYVQGAKDRGIQTIAKHMQELFGNVETLAISKGQRVVCSRNAAGVSTLAPGDLTALVFSRGELDEGTRLLLDAVEVRATDNALDIGCGAGIIGLHIARQAAEGHVTMVDASFAAVAVAQRNIAGSGLTNVRALPSDGARAVLPERFDLVVTNPPFHQGGLQSIAVAERFIREAAQALRRHGRFYLVANRFLKYEPALQASFQQVREVAGNGRYKVLRAE
jgi:16S rRNA (guanine1207-N2)-methyltransferase